MKNHVVCLSTTNYHPLPTRKQNVMSRLRNSEVLYFDPPVSIIAPLKDKKASAYISKYRQPGEKVEGHENITVYALPPVLPFFNKFRWVNKLNQKRQAAFVRKKMREHGFGDETVLWCYSPSSCDIVEQVPHSSLVYDCVDRHSAYKGHITPEVVDGMERDLAKPADQVFATAVGLAETLEKINPTTKMIPNGAASIWFSVRASCMTACSWLRNVRRWAEIRSRRCWELPTCRPTTRQSIRFAMVLRPSARVCPRRW